MSERTPQERRVADPAGRTEPYVQGPTGPAPLGSELRGDPGAEDDRASEGGAAAGAVGGAAAAGPVGAVVGGMVGATIGAATDSGDDNEAVEGADPEGDSDLTEAPDDQTVSNQRP